MIQVGVCGTDRELIRGEFGRRQWARPLVLGHEMLGEVEAVGPEVSVAPGQSSPLPFAARTVARPVLRASRTCAWPDYTERGIAGCTGSWPRKSSRTSWVVGSRTWNNRDSDRATIGGREGAAAGGPDPASPELLEPEDGHRVRRGTDRPARHAAPAHAGDGVYTLARTPAPNPAAEIVEAAGRALCLHPGDALRELAAELPPIDLVFEATGIAAAGLRGDGDARQQWRARSPDRNGGQAEEPVPTAALNGACWAATRWWPVA